MAVNLNIKYFYKRTYHQMAAFDLNNWFIYLLQLFPDSEIIYLT